MSSNSSNPDTETVAVIGLGKIGLPLAAQYSEHGRRVIGVDINPKVVDTVNSGRSHVQEEPGLASKVADFVQRGLLSATLDVTGAIYAAGVVVVIIPVVVDEGHTIDYSAIDAATTSIGQALQPGTLVIFETTLPVGTTATRLRHILEKTSMLRAGRDFYLAYSPERVSSGVIFRDLKKYPKVVGGIDNASTKAAVAFYSSVLDAQIISMKSADDAEFVKLIETTYRDVNIALANEYARFADAYGLDLPKAIMAANTQPYSHIHMPGVGVGGHCIPVYPYFLIAGADAISATSSSGEDPLLTLPRSARVINDSMAEYAVQQIESVVHSLTSMSVLILGVAYRGNVRETAFTSAKLLQRALQRHGAIVYADDPLFNASELTELGYTPYLPEYANKINAIILQADHHEYHELNLDQFTRCQVVLDGRSMLDREKITSQGISYISIGSGIWNKSH